MTKEMLLANSIDMDATLFSGQAFRWVRTETGFIGAVEDNAAIIHALQDGYRLRWDGSADEGYWHNYFDMRRDYGAIAACYSADTNAYTAFELCGGLHVLNQPLWETLCAFIISANNNDKRIRLIMRRICESLGEAREIDGHRIYLFPRAETMAGAGTAKLKELGTGYRAQYLAETSKRVAEGYNLEALREIGYEEALEELITFKGVGDKVANCILLFACGYTCAFPVDVWVERVMQRLYGIEGNRKQIKEKSIEIFGTYAGLVQQVLFHSARKSELPL